MVAKAPRDADIHAYPRGIVGERVVGYVWADVHTFLRSVVGVKSRRTFLGADVVVIISERYFLVVAL